MPFATCIITGQRGTFRLSDPRPRSTFNRTDVDEHDDSWHADRRTNEILTEGQPHPNYPGLILDSAAFEEEVPEIDGAVGSYTVQCKWLGDLRGTQPTKLIARGTERSIGPNFDEVPFTYISWTAEPRAITGTASTDLINLDGNPFLNGQRVVLVEITGGTGLTGQSATSLGTIYYVINRTADNFQLATSAGGSAVNFTTDLTAGYVLDARFALGAVHPDYAAMFLARLSLRDNYTNWKTANCTYVGKMWDKPYHRLITVNGQQMSSSDKIIWDFTDGWTDARYSNVQLPLIVVTDTYLTTDTLATTTIPYSSGEGGTPPSAPSVRSVFIFGDINSIIYNWPNGWSRLDESHVETLNSAITVHIKRRVAQYIWPISLK
jgi:hypothetical protein